MLPLLIRVSGTSDHQGWLGALPSVFSVPIKMPSTRSVWKADVYPALGAVRRVHHQSAKRTTIDQKL
jgi:hypothetical protein